MHQADRSMSFGKLDSVRARGNALQNPLSSPRKVRRTEGAACKQSAYPLTRELLRPTLSVTLRRILCRKRCEVTVSITRKRQIAIFFAVEAIPTSLRAANVCPASHSR